MAGPDSGSGPLTRQPSSPLHQWHRPTLPDCCDALREIGLHLADLARSVSVRFTFCGVAAISLADIQLWMLHASPSKEVMAVNSIFQLHRLLSPDLLGRTSIESVLGWMSEALKMKIVTIVEQEADHNNTGYLRRFNEALFYYTMMFDSLEGAATGELERSVAELYIGKEVANVVDCEGKARTERHKLLDQWWERMAAT